ncbi:LOW QUALITY PROTEIN: hypothetical protein U9M48_020441, partial [Paspalum notatum var. saurae]
FLFGSLKTQPKPPPPPPPLSLRNSASVSVHPSPRRFPHALAPRRVLPTETLVPIPSSMAAVATARDLEEVIQKLNSDRARVRDEGVKLLGTWLQGDRAISFCRLLGRNTARLKPGHGHLTGAATWPILILALLNCVKEDISGKKRVATKNAAARMLRIAVQCAEDVKLSGHSLLLISVARQLFNHIWEVIKDGPSFQLEYSIILRQLLTVKEYRYQMKPRTYSSFVVLYVKKLATGFDSKFSHQATSKDESFRCTLTLHVLLENPPGDYPGIMREEVLNVFSAIFSHIREEGKLTRKLMECINTFLLKDGPNLGHKSVMIHNAVQEFIFRCWLATHDQALKSLFITYMKVQLKLARAIPEILEKLVDIIIKELDKNVNTGAGFLWCEAPRDEKAGSLRCFQEEWMDLCATVFYMAYKCTPETPHKEKRLKTEHILNLVVDGLLKGSLFWSGSVCFLIRKHGYRVDKSLLTSWFEASCKGLRSVLSHAKAIRFQDSLLWLLRTLKEFSTVLIFNSREEAQLCLTNSEMSIVEGCWQDVWNSLIHAIPLLSSTALVADSALILLGGMMLRDQVHTSFLSEDTWNLQIFKQFPSPSALYFIACYFSRIGFQGDLSNSIFIRKTLLRSTLELVHSKEFSLLNKQNVVIIPEAIFSLCAGFSSSSINSSDTLQMFGDCKMYSKMSLEDEIWVLKDELLYSVEALSEITLDSSTKFVSDKCHRVHLPGTIQQPMLLELMEFIKGFVISNDQFMKADLNNHVFVCSLLCNLVHCALLSRAIEEKSSLLQEVIDYITNILKHMVSFVMKKKDELSHGLTNLSSELDTTGSALSLMSNSDGENAGKVLPISSVNSEDVNPIFDCKSSVADMDLDVMDSGEVDSITASASGSTGSFLRPSEWKLELVCIISTFFSVSSLRTWEILYNLVEKESDVRVRQVILLNLCRNIPASSKTVSSMVHLIIDMRDRGASSLLSSDECLAHTHALLRTLIAIRAGRQNTDGKPQGCKMFLSENQDILFDLVNKAAEISSVDWFSRIKLIDCVSSFVCLFPDIAQDLIGCLLDMLNDTDYRVRLYLAREIVLGPLYTLRFPPCAAPSSTSPSHSSSAAFATTASSMTWHHRLGHPGRDALAQLSCGAAITCPQTTDEHLCHACQLGRHVRLPFPTSSHASHIFNLIHCDLWTSPVPSISGYKYYLVVLDDFSHYSWTFPLRFKSEAFTTISDFFAWVSTQFGLTIKAVQCDNGREFDNNASRSFLSRAVQLRMSCPYTSAQNGKAERMIRTTNDVMRTLLFQASLPARFWAESLHTATYLLNRLPSTACLAPTPHHAVFGTLPRYDHLRVFGYRYKARWVLRGFTQRPGVDYDEIFSPVVKPATVRTLDVKNAFLHGTLTETVYCSQPAGFVDPARPEMVCRLNKSLYGLKQAPRAWYSRFATFLVTLGFTEAKHVYCHGAETAYLLLYVDDIVLTASSRHLLQQIISSLQQEFAMKDLGVLHHFLGVTVEPRPSGLLLHQRQYTLDILERAGMTDCNPCSTPVDTQAKLSEDVGAPVADPIVFRSFAGALHSTFGAKMVKFSNSSPVIAKEVFAVGPQSVPVIETALITLAHLSVHSEDVEVECVFMISAAAAIEPSQRELAYALFDSISKRLGYASRSKYLEQVMGPILFRWVACEMSLVSLVEVQGMFGYGSAEPKAFVEHCSSWLLPFLILRGDHADINWLSKILSQPLSIIIKKYFVPIFGLCIAVRCGTGPEKDLAETVLCESVLQLGEISELERDDLIKKHMVAIVAFLLSVSSSAHSPQIPYFPKEIVALSIRTVVDGFVDTTDDDLVDTVVIDKINIFRSDRVFKFLLSIHQEVADASHPRHMGHYLCAIEVLIDVLGHRVVLESTCFYIVCIVGNYIQQKPLQGQCCNILSKLLAAFDGNPSAQTVEVLGRQLQILVPKLVTSCINMEKEERTATADSSRVLSLLRQLTVDADPLLYDYIRELEPLPGLDCLKDVHEFHASLSASHSSRDQFLKFVKRAPYLPPELFLLSLHTYHKKLLLGEIICRNDLSLADADIVSCWSSDPDVISAVWTLVDLCSSSSIANEASSVLADFISRAGISDAHQVIFNVPTDTQNHPLQLHNGSASKEAKLCSDYGIPDDILVELLKLLKTYLSDESVEIIDAASQTLRGILSTARGLNALQCLDSLDRSLLMVHSRGVNIQVVEQIISGMEKCSGVSLEDSDVWQTDGRTYKQWLSTLVSSLICHCDDIILRLCRSLVCLKAKAAELLLASTLVNLAGNVDSNTALCRLISTKVENIIFSDSNHSLKSIHLLLDALNAIRSFYVAEKARTYPSNTLKDGRSARSKSRSPATTPSSSWRKVYWLSVDYLVTARAASRCSCEFATLMYVELWCEEQFNRLALGPPEFSYEESLPSHVGLLVAAFSHINEPDSIYGLTLANEITSQLIRYEHEGDWSSALEYYDLLVRSTPKEYLGNLTGAVSSRAEDTPLNWKMHKGLMRSLQKTGCGHVLDVYCEGLTHQKGCLQQDEEFIDIQYEAAWRAGNWDFSFFIPYSSCSSTRTRSYCLFNENLHSCLRALQNGDSEEFHGKLSQTKMDLVLALSNTSKESTKYIHSTILKLQMLDHVTMVWDLRCNLYPNQTSKSFGGTKGISPISTQLELLDKEWNFIVYQTKCNLDLFEPFLAFRRACLKILGCEEHLIKHLFQAASALRKGLRFSLAAAALHELKDLCFHKDDGTMPNTYFLSRLEEAKLLRAQGQHDMAISLGKYILQKHPDKKNMSDVYRLVGKWLAETRSSNSRTIIEDYLRPSIDLTEFEKTTDKRSYEERLSSNEWQAALRLRKYKTRELETLIKTLKCSSKGVKTDYSVKIQELQKQLALDREEAQKIQDDRDNFLNLALQGYQRSLVVGGKYDLQVVFRLVSLWFSLFSRDQVVKAMVKTTKEVQTYKFIPLVYQIASRLGSSKDAQGSTNFQQIALASLLKKMAIDHPYHTIFQILSLANGDRVKDKQRSRSSFVVDMEKKLAAENLLKELSSCHGALICQMKQMVEIYIKLAELETKKEVPVVTATVPVDPSCRYGEGSFPHFTGLADSVMIMNGINAPKVIECFGSDGNKYRQLAKSGNDDLRQDAFGLTIKAVQCDNGCEFDNHASRSFFLSRGVQLRMSCPYTSSQNGKAECMIRTTNDVMRTLLFHASLPAHFWAESPHRHLLAQPSTLHCLTSAHSTTLSSVPLLATITSVSLGVRVTPTPPPLLPTSWRPVRLGVCFLVVPFTPSAGVVEWVNGTVPLGEYLLGSTKTSGAHGRYGIGDWTFLQCREYMMSEKDKRRAFLKICNNFRPVMHHFFLERFFLPADWFQSRLAYTRSVAASSMVGYIVGLGDRHSMNILIDQDTAEVVHIDLGVAFEQGLMLKTPERVPFRLTRDIIDGMGVTGVEGVFRRCCEKTLSVMRANKDALLTIIEETDDTDSCLDDSQETYEGNKDAARAILRVKQKLDGYEDGEMRSVQGQVQQLIQDAVDVDRLCQMVATVLFITVQFVGKPEGQRSTAPALADTIILRSAYNCFDDIAFKQFKKYDGFNEVRKIDD